MDLEWNNDLWMFDEADEVVNFEEFSDDQLVTPTKKKGSYSFTRKLEVIDYSKKNSVKSTAQKFNISRSRVQDWKKQEAQIRRQL